MGELRQKWAKRKVEQGDTVLPPRSFFRRRDSDARRTTQFV
jgi:hypothetical protein